MRSFLCSVCLALAFVSPVVADAAGDHVEATIRAVLRGADASAIAARLEASSTRLETLAAEAPETWVRAHLVLTRRTHSDQIAKWGSGGDVEILRLESQTPTGRDDEVITAWLGGFHSVDAPFATQLEGLEANLRSAWNDARARVPREGAELTDAPRRERFVWDRAPFLYVAAEVLAQAATLDDFARTGISAATILVDEDVAPLVRALAELPTRPMPVLPIEKPQAAVGSSVGSKAGIDSGGKHFSTKMLQSCGMGGTENNCPPDATWLPSASMGVGARAEFSSVVANRSGFTEGDFYTSLRWGTAAGPPGGRINTAAFKSTSSPACDPDLSISSLSAPCNRSQSNVIYVPGSTFESEGLVPNNRCLLPARTGTSFDLNAGCFLPTAGFTSLPGAFLDTTLSDGRTPLNAAIGTVTPERLAEGVTYETYVYFWAFGTEVVLFQRAIHNGQIGTDSFPCPLPSAFCTFAVDTSRLGDDIYLPLLPF